MKYLLSLILAAAFVCQSCGARPDGNVSAKDATPDTGPVMAAVNKVKATYRSDFGGSPIYVSINYTNGWQVGGFNVHKGLRRNLRGELSAAGEDWKVVLKEPGDHPYDGQFTLTFNHDFTKAKGSWAPMNSKELTAKKLDLERMGEDRGYENGAVLYLYADEHADLSFNDDGSCDFNFYPIQPDSSFAKQMTEIHGSWTQRGDKVLVNWSGELQPGKKSSEFELRYRYDTMDNKISKVAETLIGEGFELGSMEF